MHWRRLRTSNKLERLNLEIRRRLNSIGRHPDETGCLTLIQQVTTRYAKDTRGVSVTELVVALWKRLREQKKEMLTQLTLELCAS
ncbi:transposase, partial [Pseudomonas sp. GW531-E2]|uniref:transposase n=1 Tax=Pseudomonas sp. GW531-E2 TaxID=2070679 RepID=UPI0034D36598